MECQQKQVWIEAENEQYAENVVLTVLMKETDFQQFKTKITDVTNGKTIFQNEIETEYRESI